MPAPTSLTRARARARDERAFGVCEQTLLQRRRHAGCSLNHNQIRGWIAVSAAVLQGKGLRKRSLFVHRRRYGIPYISLWQYTIP